MNATNKLAILSLLCLPIVSNAGIDTYYVSPSGNDNNDGKSWETAFATPNKGFDTINITTNRGSHLWIDSGEYALTKAIGVNGGGNESARSFVRSRTGKPKDVVLYSDGTFECLRLGAFITISGITFSNGINNATCPSGGIRFSEHNDVAYKMIVSNCIVTCCNNAYGTGTNGAAVAIYGHNLMVDSIIRNNTSETDGAGVLIMNNDSFKGVPRLERCRIEGNVAKGKGGGIYVSTIPRATTYQSHGNAVEIIDSEIIGNGAANGAGVHFATVNLTANLTGCVISNNTATSNSGGMRLENGANMVMQNCLVEDNKAGSGAGADVIGANASATTALTCSNTVFRNNNATSTGGGVRIYNYARAMFEDSVFSENSAGNTGGGIYFNAQGKGWFNGCRFEGNKATSTTVSDDRGGGGIFLGAQTVTVRGYCSVSNCVFASNTSGSRAGGMGGTWNKGYFGGAIVNCVFTNNASQAQGGGLVIRDNSSSSTNPAPPVIRNCLFAFNETTGTTGDTGGGGLMFATYSDITLENCTIVSNNIWNTSGYKSGGIHHRFTGKLKNCIVAFNTVCGEREDANYWNDVNTLTTDNFINCCSDLANNKFGSSCVIGDPKFVDPANGDFRIQPDSPCRDKGANEDWMSASAIDPVTGRRVKALDLAGVPRLYGAYVDIGCYEVWFPKGTALTLR